MRRTQNGFAQLWSPGVASVEQLAMNAWVEHVQRPLLDVIVRALVDMSRAARAGRALDNALLANRVCAMWGMRDGHMEVYASAYVRAMRADVAALIEADIATISERTEAARLAQLVAIADGEKRLAVDFALPPAHAQSVGTCFLEECGRFAADIAQLLDRVLARRADVAGDDGASCVCARGRVCPADRRPRPALVAVRELLALGSVPGTVVDALRSALDSQLGRERYVRACAAPHRAAYAGAGRAFPEATMAWAR